MEQLIEEALAHAKRLRQSANAADDYGARAAEAEAERWERLASAAQRDASIFLPGMVAEGGQQMRLEAAAAT